MTPVELIKKIASGESNILLPLTLVLADGQRIECEQVLRLLPEKRLVLRVTIDEQRYILKLFSAAGGRAAKRERIVLDQLAATAIPHAKLVKQQVFADGSAVHIYQFIDNACSPSFTDHDLIKAVSALLCDILQAGWMQTDPHPDNFLCNAQGVWLIDAGSLQKIATRNKRIVEKCLAVWIAQFPLEQHAAIASNLLQTACAVLSSSVKGITSATLCQNARRQWKKRRNAYLAKIMRNCTEVEAGTSGNSVWRIRREYGEPQLREFLHNPEQCVAQGVVLKSGNGTHIVKIKLDGRELIIKRYNSRGIWQGIKTRLGYGRARHNWWASHLLQFCGIQTPAPVAMLETGSVSNSIAYIVTEAVGGVEYFHAFDAREPTETELRMPVTLLAALQSNAIEHGDMKAKNMLLDNDKLWLIDLDALRVDSVDWFLRKDKDVERFLRNWLDRPQLAKSFARLIVDAGLPGGIVDA